MFRVMAFDYGSRRIGIAVTDTLQIISTALTTIHPKDVIVFLKQYLIKEKVERFVVGMPKQMNNQPSQSAPLVKGFIKTLKKHFSNIPIETIDERFTSKIASQVIASSNLKKSDRQKKEHIDSISAVLILQAYLEQKSLMG